MTLAGPRLSILCVGGGVSGTALVIALVRAVQGLPAALRERAASMLSVVVVEATGVHGPGLPYGDQAQPFHLMNMESHTVSLLGDREDDFVSWLSASGSTGDDGRDSAGGFVPRNVFGAYAVQRLGEYAELGSRLGLDIRLVCGTVTGLRRVAGGFEAALGSGATIRADRLVLASGHWRAEHGLADNALAPWPARELADATCSARHITMVGTSLTAVDALLTISHARGRFVEGKDGWLEYEPGPRGEYRITAVSRNGLLPMVRAPEPAPAEDGVGAGNPYLAKEVRSELGESGTAPVVLDQVRTRFTAALRWTADRVGGGPPAWSPVLASMSPGRTGDRTAEALGLVGAGLELARHPDPRWVGFQSTVRGFFSTLNWFYRSMDRRQRTRLLTEFFTPFLSEAGAMPVQNARKIGALLRSGTLRVHAGGPDADAPAPEVTVNAIGRARAIAPHSGIAGQAIVAGLVDPNPHGGIHMDPDSGLALRVDGTTIPDIAVLGPLAVGSYLGSSGVYASVKFARSVTDQWVAEALTTAYQEART
ncbi:MAG TPA: FAD/NAD(P)-binding protein [Streptomyces sp.]|nr:FAD/NAD(P)-binding protein [Streptomyces sp.]